MKKNTLCYYISIEGDDRAPGTIGSPLATLYRALEIVKEQNISDDIHIYFREGTYYFDKTAVIDKSIQANADRSLYISNWQNENVLISGGFPVVNWEKAGMEDPKIWKAEVPWIKEDNHSFHSLFKQGSLLKRARSHSSLSVGFETTRPRMGSFPTDFCTTFEARTEFHFPERSIKKEYSLKDLEIFMSPQRPWLVNYLSLESVDFDNNKGILKSQATYELFGRFILENHLDFLTEPGEWVLESEEGTLYYMPEGPEPEDGIVAPYLQELIRIEGQNDLEGSDDDPVANIHIAGLTFSHCDRETVQPDDKGLQHDWAFWDKANSLVRFRGAENCSLKNCRLENSGSAAVRLDLYCRNIDVSENRISNVGSMGVLLAGYGPGYKDVNGNNRIYGNDISNTGTLYGHSMGIFIWQSGDNLIARNHVYDLGYMGIVLSGVRRRFWDPEMRPRDIRELIPLIDFDKTAHLEGGKGEWKDYVPYMHTTRNRVEYNEIHDCMRRLGDGNTIYLSAVGPDNIIKGNLAYNHHKNFLMRTDDDTFDSVWEKNILIGSSGNPRGFTHKGINSFNNNFLINCALGVYTGPHGPSEGINSIKRNIFYFTTAVKGNLLNDKSGFAPGKIDNNLYYSSDPESLLSFLEKRHNIGSDDGSMIADPGFGDLSRLDLSWEKDSPADVLGIQSAEIEKIGPPNAPSAERIIKKGKIKISGVEDLETMIVG